MQRISHISRLLLVVLAVLVCRYRIHLAVLLSLAWCGCVMGSTPAVDGLDIVVVSQGVEPPCSSAEVHLELRDGQGRKVSKVSIKPRAQGDPNVRWETGELSHGSYTVAALVTGCHGISSIGPKVRLALEENSSIPYLTVLYGSERDSFSLCWIGSCSATEVSNKFEILPGTPPRLRNVSQDTFAVCRESFGKVWDVERFVDGKWGEHDVAESFGPGDEIETIGPGEEIVLEPFSVTVFRLGSSSVFEAPRRLKVLLAPALESLVDSPECASDVVFPGCCDQFLIRWPETTSIPNPDPG